MLTLATLEKNPSKEPLRTIIWLHGLGANCHDFEPIVEQLGIHDSHKIRFIFPDAPSIPVTLNGNLKMQAWFDVYEMKVDAKLDLAGINRSKIAIEQLIEEEVRRGIATENIILAGFSQGAAMSLTVGLQYKDKLGGIIALSGYLPNAEDVINNLSPQNENCPIFLAHGTADPILPYPLGLETCEALMRAKLPLSWHSYYMPHSVCDEEVSDIRKWIVTTCC